MHISVEVCVLERDTLPPPTAPRAYVTFVICVTNRKRAFLFLCIARGFKLLFIAMFIYIYKKCVMAGAVQQ